MIATLETLIAGFPAAFLIGVLVGFGVCSRYRVVTREATRVRVVKPGDPDYEDPPYRRPDDDAA